MYLGRRDRSIEDCGKRKRRRRDHYSSLKVINLISSDDECDTSNNPQSVDVASPPTSYEDRQVLSATLDEDESDEDIIDVYCNGRLITSAPEDGSENDFEVDSEHDIDDGPPLCPEQAEVVDIITQRRNVFYTGPAGSGKSRFLKAFAARL